MPSIRVYAFTDDAGKLALAQGGNKLDDIAVQMVSNGMLHAIVAPEPMWFPWQDEERTALDTLMRYHRVCGAASKLGKVVPASMDCLFQHTSSIFEALGQHQRDILDVLSRYGSSRQFSLYVQWDPQLIEPLITRYGNGLSSSFEKERRTTRNHILQQLQHCLSDIIILDSNDVRLVMQTLLLIPSHAEERLVRILSEIDRDCHGRLIMRLVGPLPACNFARIDIHLPEAQSVREACKVLGIRRETRLADIKNAFRQKIKGLHPDHVPDAHENEIIVRLTQSYRFLSRLAAQQNSLVENDPDRQWLRCDSKTLRHTPLLSIQRGLTRHDDALLIGYITH